MSASGLTISHLSRDSFVALLRFVLDEVGVRAVHVSRAPSPRPPGLLLIAPEPRFDIPLSGVKHMKYASGGAIRDVMLRPGEVHYAPPHLWKLPVWDTPHEMSSLVLRRDYIRVTYIDFSELTDFYASHAATVFYHTTEPVGAAGSALVQALNVLPAEAVDACAPRLVEVLLRLVLAKLERADAPGNRKAQNTWARIVQYMQENLHHPISRKRVAQAFALHPNYLSRLFTREGGESFSATLRRFRLEHAALLMRTTDYTLAEITEQCGYASQTFLATAFKRHFTCTPGQYRTSQSGGGRDGHP